MSSHLLLLPSFLQFLSLGIFASFLLRQAESAPAAVDDIRSVDGCLLNELRAKVCDPEGILTQQELESLDAELAELEEATVTEFYPSPPLWEFLHASKCPVSGLTLSLLLFQDLNSLKIAAKEVANMHWRWSLAHPCAKTAVAMINFGAGATKDGEKPKANVALASVSAALNRQPILVGTRFFGISSENTDLAPVELAQAYFNQSSLVKSGRIADALSGMVDRLRNGVMLRM